MNFSAINARKTECIRGHPFDKENTYIRPDGERNCRLCSKLHDHRYKIKMRILNHA